MNCTSFTMAVEWSRAARHVPTLLGVACALAGCRTNQAIQRADVPSAEEAWVASACTPAHPDFSTWTRRRVGGVTVAAPPGFIVEQGPPTNIGIRSPARSTYGLFSVVRQQEAQQMFDSYYYRQQQRRNVCRASLSGYPADVVATYDRGRYTLIARWQAEWGGEDSGKWLLATITSSRPEEATELRAILHTVRPEVR